MSSDTVSNFTSMASELTIVAASNVTSSSWFIEQFSTAFSIVGILGQFMVVMIFGVFMLFLVLPLIYVTTWYVLLTPLTIIFFSAPLPPFIHYHFGSGEDEVEAGLRELYAYHFGWVMTISFFLALYKDFTVFIEDHSITSLTTYMLMARAFLETYIYVAVLAASIGMSALVLYSIWKAMAYITKWISRATGKADPRIEAHNQDEPGVELRGLVHDNQLEDSEEHLEVRKH